ncbi:hypothetical protein CCMA1212_003847 [Trichoderma ghanense]|uniref:Uncharacterized protein n=1 Tax=Trichoderma ghanense TaxID=65468 RepID=A0ABY2H9E1_9HYPO
MPQPRGLASEPGNWNCKAERNETSREVPSHEARSTKQRNHGRTPEAVLRNCYGAEIPAANETGNAHVH